MFYEINVAKDGRHYFATAARSLSSLQDAEALYAEFVLKFPAAEGYTLTLSQYQSTGRDIKCSR